MKLVLINFRCYSKKEIDLGDKGLTLISGNSGVGKSTILIAINFVLYGKGNKLIKHGEKSCSVILEFEDLKIERSKKPNRLIINNVYEDDIAQNIINKKFGDNFNVTGYISQNSINSFVLMSPMDKLLFIENIAMNNLDINEKKIKCKNLIKERKEELIRNTSKLEMSKEILNKNKKPIQVEFPFKTKNKEKTIKNEEIRKKNCSTLILKYQRIINKLKEELIELKNFKNTYEIYNNDIKDVKTQLISLEKEKENLDVIPSDLEEKTKILELIIKYKEINNLTSIYEKNKKEVELIAKKEREEILSKIKKIEDSIWIEYEKNEIDEEINLNKECLKDIIELEKYNKELKLLKYNNVEDIEKKLTKLNNSIIEYKSDIEIKQKKLNNLILCKNVYDCPKCKSKLKIIKNKLDIVENLIDVDNNESIDTVEKEMKILNEKIKLYSSEISDLNILKDKVFNLNIKIKSIVEKYEIISDIEEVKENLKSLKDYKIENITQENELISLKNNLKKNIYSNTYNQLLNNLKKLEIDIDVKKNNIVENDFNIIKNFSGNENELRNYINKNNILVITTNNINKNIEILHNDVKKIEDKISTLISNYKEKYDNIRDNSIIEDEISCNLKNISEQEDKLKEHEIILEKINKYKMYEEELLKWNELNEEVIKYENLEKDARDKYISSQKLLSIILEVESKCILRTIDNINVHTQFYLDKPMNIMLKTYKMVKNDKINKPQINIDIIYKNMECDISMLSGGELSRVILAYTLALGEIFNIPFLMLDESTASLDQEMTTIVFEKISENFTNKLVIIIAHQIITGVFNKIIYL
jgi:exonuclease SbcC